MAEKKTKKTTSSKTGTAKIKVVGVGGAGGSAIQRMVAAKILGVEYIAINTDNQALSNLSRNIKKIRIGQITKGQGTGSDVNLGQQAVEKNASEIKRALQGADVIFLTAGFGGGTGTGGTMAIADLLEKTKALTVAIVTKPFSFEGSQKKSIAEKGIKKISNRVDSFIPIFNDKLLQVIDQSTPLLEAFDIADEVLKQGVQGISDILNIPGLINIDFADVKPILQGAGKTLLGIGYGQGEERVKQAVQGALKNSLMSLSIKGATGVVFVITGSPDLKMMEVNEIAEMITEQVDPRAKVVFGAVIDKKLKDKLKITLIATGFDRAHYHGFEAQDLEEEEEDDFTSPRIISQEKEIHVYKNDDSLNQEDEKIKTDLKTGIEDELEIPAFLRKKSRKNK